MTVEQTPLGHFQDPIQKDYESALKWLKETTGVEDLPILKEALEASKKEYGLYDLDQAVAIVYQENDKKEIKGEGDLPKLVGPLTDRDTCIQSPDDPLTKQQQTDTADAVIDLTHESEKDDLQKAIALSLQEQHGVLGGQVTMEEEDISRVLEASLLESKVIGTRRKRGELYQDPLNPHDRKRLGDWPVGLKNMGNTCWFAAVIQSLFHLPAFQHLVLNFKPLKDSESAVEEPPRHHSLLFMRELRKLFALMVASDRKYLDPSQALEVVKEAFPNSASTDNQQDVSEFSHKLIEWLEDAYKFCSTECCSDTRNINPMTRLFYGHFKSEGLNGDRHFSNDAKFGQYPLQMNGFSEIHESLESAVVAQEIEASGSGNTCNFGQETWFTQLPPVLVFQLSRFQFNQHLGVPEKIHNKFEFPEVMFMDRYLEINKCITRTKRELVRKLKEDRGKLLKRLERYLNYGSGPKRVPLQDVLQYALEFAETKSDCRETSIKSTTHEDMEMTLPQTSKDNAQTSAGENNKIECLPTAAQSAENISCSKHISEAELRVFQSWLNRWRVEVESDVKELQDKIGMADNTIKEIFNDSSLQKVRYRLHAVLVHEGQAVSGHYWAYVYDRQREAWLKFNDVTVTEANWLELQKESVGGYHHASAYCLMYVDEGTENLFQSGTVTNAKNLSEELQQYVALDNALFIKEQEKWDVEQSHKKDCSTMTSTEVPTGARFRMHALQLSHASLVLKQTRRRIENLSQESKNNIAVAYSECMSGEIQDMKCKAQRVPDSRIDSVGIYFLQNGLPVHPFLKLVILEQLSLPELVDSVKDNQLIIQLRRMAVEELEKTWTEILPSGVQKRYLEWHELFSSFRKVINAFVIGMKKYHEERYEEAMQYLVDAFAMNSKLVTNEKNINHGFSPRILGFYRKKCLLKLNEIAIGKFRDETDSYVKVTSLIDDYIIPGMALLSSQGASKVDSDAAVEIRDSWCNMIENQISEEKQKYMEDILQKLCETSKEAQVCKPRAVLRICDLYLEFYSAMQEIRDSGDMQLIEETKE